MYGEPMSSRTARFECCISSTWRVENNARWTELTEGGHSINDYAVLFLFGLALVIG